MRHDHGQDDQQHDQLVAAEAELGKTVGDEAADKGLQHAAQHRDDERVAERLGILQLGQDCFVDIQREVLGNQAHGHVHEVLRGHEGACDFGKEGVQHDVRNTDQQNQPEDIPCHLLEEVQIQELRLHTLLQGRAVEFNLDLVLGLLHYLWGRLNVIHYGASSFPYASRFW